MPRVCMRCIAPGAVVTPIWDKAEAQDISRYEATPYWGALRAFGKLMADDGRAGHTPEHVGRCTTSQLPSTIAALTCVLAIPGTSMLHAE